MLLNSVKFSVTISSEPFEFGSYANKLRQALPYI